jgi:integrase
VVRPRQVGGKSSATRFISHMGVVLGLARAELGTDVMPYSADELVGNVKILTKRSLEAVVKNRAAAPYLQVPQLLSDMRSSGAIQPVHKCAVELAILNASRINEIVGGEWSEVDLDQGVWVVPAARMKGRTEYRQVHTLPLSPRSIEVLRELQSIAAAAGVQSQYIFDGALTAQGIAGKPISPSQVLKATIKKVPLRDADGAVVPVTMHGFRSTFKTWAEDTGKYKNSVSESQLDHAVGNKVQRAYDKSKRTALRHEMITDWADFVTGAKAFESVIDDTFQSARAV